MRFHSGTFPIHHKPREVQITMVTLHGWWLISWSRFLGCWLDVNFTGKGCCCGLLPAGIQEGGGREAYRTVCLLPQTVRCCWGCVHFLVRFSNVNLQAIFGFEVVVTMVTLKKFSQKLEHRASSSEAKQSKLLGGKHRILLKIDSIYRQVFQENQSQCKLTVAHSPRES